MGVTAKLAQQDLAVDPGGEVTLEILVRNNGTQVDAFALEVLGDARAWAELHTASLRLFPGTEEVAQVTFRPPRAPLTAARAVPFAVKVISGEDPQSSTVEEGVLRVGAFTETNAELLPRTSRGSWRGRHRLALDNRGNIPLQADVSAAAPDRALSFEVRPRTLTAPPGTASFGQVLVRPRKRFWRGTPKTLAFEVSVRPTGQPAISLQGTMVQLPVLGGWLPKVALAVIGVLVACALLWFLALRPAIQSAAKDAVAPGLARQQAATAAGQKAIADLQKQVGSGASVTASPTPTPAAAPANPQGSNPLGSAVDGRLSGTGASATYAVPNKGTLSITDLVFENPNGDKGSSIRLQRDTTDLFVLKLDNFRDLDYHFVTPIVIDQNHSLTFVSSGSSSSVYYSGYLKTSQ